MNQPLSRRDFVQGVAVTAGVVLGGLSAAEASETKKLHLSTNSYPWQTFYRRAGRDYGAHGCRARRGGGSRTGRFRGRRGHARRTRPTVPPAEKTWLGDAVAVRQQHAARSEAGRSEHRRYPEDRGTSSCCRNAGDRNESQPNPLGRVGKQNRSADPFQARALNRLGRELKERGLTLAYHFHDIELRMAARELHHMMMGTEPEMVTMCLDAHWVYRGAGNSEVARGFDIARLYADRISELHIRQSKDGIWTEAFGPGDINYSETCTIVAAVRYSTVAGTGTGRRKRIAEHDDCRGGPSQRCSIRSENFRPMA